jgi:hypothetical protein
VDGNGKFYSDVTFKAEGHICIRRERLFPDLDLHVIGFRSALK